MEKKKYKKLFVIAVFVLVVSQIAAFTNYFGSTYIGWCVQLVKVCTFIPIIKYSRTERNYLWMAYLLTMLVGLLFHTLLPDKAFYDNFMEVMGWLLVVYLLFVANLYESKVLKYFLLGFFILNCSIAFIERSSGVRWLEYDNEILESFVSSGDLMEQDFRSFALLGHPLSNACVTSIIMGFILTYQRIKWTVKFLLLSIGLLGFWGFNSRGAILVWIVILLYRFTLYHRSSWKAIIPTIIVIVAFPFLIDYVNSGALGRFSFDFSDGSSATRWESFLFFGMQDWNLETILLGGRYIKMPGSEFLLENGILLNLSYWGWLVGFLKTLLEICITCVILRFRNKKEIFIIMISFWGVALTNNIITGVLPLTFFLFAYSGIGRSNVDKN